jgi:hypothetical protein
MKFCLGAPQCKAISKDYVRFVCFALKNDKVVDYIKFWCYYRYKVNAWYQYKLKASETI